MASKIQNWKKDQSPNFYTLWSHEGIDSMETIPTAYVA
jgi:hypothetical protein